MLMFACRLLSTKKSQSLYLGTFFAGFSVAVVGASYGTFQLLKVSGIRPTEIFRCFCVPHTLVG
jgi:hypothetical protein